MTNITDEQIDAAVDAFKRLPLGVESGTLKDAMRETIRAADAAAWSKDITKADKSRRILVKTTGGYIVNAYYDKEQGWLTSIGWSIDFGVVDLWRYLPEPPKEPK